MFRRHRVPVPLLRTVDMTAVTSSMLVLVIRERSDATLNLIALNYGLESRRYINSDSCTRLVELNVRPLSFDDVRLRVFTC